jgi:hypothetical protein
MPDPGVNIFLYRISPNLAFRHADLPARQADGTLLRRPQAALDLHYLLTFHGDDNLEVPQRLLGAVVRRLHTEPTLRRDDIRGVAGQAQLAGTDLADQRELVRVVPDEMSVDDLSRLWTMFPETSYFLSALYMASVVLIEAEVEAPAPGPPVRDFRLHVVPLALPVIEAVDPQAVDADPPGARINLRGRNLLAGTAAQTTVSIDGGAPFAVDATSTPESVVVALPAGLPAGVHMLRIVRADPLGAPHVGSASNPAVLVLRPRLVSSAFGATSLGAASITAVLAPRPGIGQRVALLLNELAGGAVARSFTLPARRRIADADPVSFEAAALPAGTNWLVRAQVDGVETAMEVDAAGDITGPVLHVP